VGGLSRRGPGLVALALLVVASGSVAGASSARPRPDAVRLLPARAKPARVARPEPPLTAVLMPDPALIVTRGGDVADPFVMKVGSSFLLFSSQATFFGENIPLRVSSSLTDWNTPAIDAMPQLPAWADDGFTWGPDVRRIGSRYVLWFSAALRSSGSTLTKCIGEATSRSPYGPYRAGAQPFVCQLDHEGSIDPRSFVDGRGRLWLIWKSDDNADVDGTPHSTIWVQRLSRDGLHLVEAPTALVTADQPWEGRIVEAPDMVEAAGHYWLFYSGNWFNQPAYAIGVAECAGPTGPCVKPLAQPWLSSNEQGSGPGEESVFTDAQGSWLLYSPYAVDYQASTPRSVALLRLGFDRFGPYPMAPGAPLRRTPRPRPPVVVSERPGLGPVRGVPSFRLDPDGGLPTDG
jgi:beta-xylosidase